MLWVMGYGGYIDGSYLTFIFCKQVIWTRHSHIAFGSAGYLLPLNVKSSFVIIYRLIIDLITYIRLIKTIEMMYNFCVKL